ncbi:unnamed protein product (mitochondrion) [Plasmodiophora brassicae]|uniref:Uncharacterized protein n=1 Tax=Plasmodiophora brassicae TaxID=37360 RepID=A0A3P3Y8T5_PLABS|nr:unnamed protein product [Plasmodiophora brassicae]
MARRRRIESDQDEERPQRGRKRVETRKQPTRDRADEESCTTTEEIGPAETSGNDNNVRPSSGTRPDVIEPAREAHPNHLAHRKDESTFIRFQRKQAIDVPRCLLPFCPSSGHHLKASEERKGLVERAKQLFSKEYCNNEDLLEGSNKSKNQAVHRSIILYLQNDVGIPEQDAEAWPYDESRRMIKTFLSNAKGAAGLIDSRPEIRPRFKGAKPHIITGQPGQKFDWLRRLWHKMSAVPDDHADLSGDRIIDSIVRRFVNEG